MGETKKSPFHITITDNETGEELYDVDTDVVIGAVHIERGKASGMCVSRCGGISMAETIASAEAVIQQLEADDPLQALAKAMLKPSIIEGKE